MKLNGDDHFPTKEEIQTSSKCEGEISMKWQSDVNNKKPAIRRILVAGLVSLIIGAITIFTAFMVMSRHASSPIVALTDLDHDHPNIPKGYIEEVWTDLSDKDHPLPSNSTHRLGKRQAYITDPIKCHGGDKFIERQCDDNSDPSGWVDVCMAGKKRYTVQGRCHTEYPCTEHLDPRGRWPVILCRDTIEHADEYSTGPGTVGQYGFREIPASPNAHMRTETIIVNTNTYMKDASISGYLVNEQTTGILKGSAPLVAHVRGDTFEICNHVGKEKKCRPRGTRYLARGMAIDFTFGTVPNQRVYLYYSLWGSSG